MVKKHLTNARDVHLSTSEELEMKATTSNPLPSFFLYSSNTNTNVENDFKSNIVFLKGKERSKLGKISMKQPCMHNEIPRTEAL